MTDTNHDLQSVGWNLNNEVNSIRSVDNHLISATCSSKIDIINIQPSVWMVLMKTFDLAFFQAHGIIYDCINIANGGFEFLSAQKMDAYSSYIHKHNINTHNGGFNVNDLIMYLIKLDTTDLVYMLSASGKLYRYSSVNDSFSAMATSFSSHTAIDSYIDAGSNKFAWIVSDLTTGLSGTFIEYKIIIFDYITDSIYHEFQDIMGNDRPKGLGYDSNKGIWFLVNDSNASLNQKS